MKITFSLLLSLILLYGCKKEEDPPIKVYEYNIVGRITPLIADTNHYWPNVWCRLFIIYDDYQSPPQLETEIVRADSLGYVHFTYTRKEDRRIKSISLLVASDSLNQGPWYCRITPSCSIDSTNFFINDCCIQQGDCIK